MAEAGDTDPATPARQLNLTIPHSAPLLPVSNQITHWCAAFATTCSPSAFL